MPIPATEFIWFNGKLVPWEKATVHVLSHALHYGSSVFEGVRAYETPRRRGHFFSRIPAPPDSPLADFMTSTSPGRSYRINISSF